MRAISLLMISMAGCASQHPAEESLYECRARQQASIAHRRDHPGAFNAEIVLCAGDYIKLVDRDAKKL